MRIRFCRLTGPVRTVILCIVGVFATFGGAVPESIGLGIVASEAQSGDLAEAQARNRQIGMLYAEGRYAEAIPLAERVLAIYEKVFGPRHLQTATALNNLAELHRSQGQYAKAEPLHMRALAIREKVLGSEHPDTAVSLNNLALLYSNQGRYAKAEPHYVRALTIREKVLGPGHPDTALSLNNLALLYDNQGLHAKAEPLYVRALAIYEKLYGPEHLQTALLLNNLAELHRNGGQYRRAEPLYVRALAIFEKELGPDHPLTATSLNNLALLYDSQGLYGKAEPLYVRALAIFEKAFGAEHPQTAQSLNNLARLYTNQGLYPRAEPLYVRALAVRERVLGPEHPLTAAALNNLAALYQSQGLYAKAEPFYVRALAVSEKALGPEHSQTATALDNLAALYDDQGRYAKAEPLYVRALTIREKVLGPEHPNTALSLNNLAKLYSYQGQYRRAEPFCVRALAIREKVLGPEHPDTALSLNNLALIYGYQEQYAKAEPLYVRALTIREKVLGPEHPNTALSLNNLAGLYDDQGQYARAEPLYVRALAIREKVLGLEHPSTALSLNNLAGLYTAMGDYPRAVTTQARANDVRERAIVRNLASGSEREKFLYLEISSGELDQTLSLHARHAPSNETAKRIALEIILRRKGRALDATTRQVEALRERATREDRRLLDELSAAQSELSRVTLAGPGREGMDAHRARVASLEQKAGRLQAEVGRRSQQFAVENVSISLDAVQAVIPDDAKLVEYATYRPYDARAQRLEALRYVVYVTGRDGRIGWADLGEATAIDALVAEFRTLVRSNRTDVDSEFRPVARRLEAVVMEPVRRLAGASTRMLVSPDGALNLVPFAALVDESGRYLVERYDIQYLTSGRDLLRLVARRAGAIPVVVANPEFGTRPADSKRKVELTADGSTAGSSVELAGAVFTPLPGTAEEADAISRLVEARVLVRAEATEAALKRVAAPEILHVATHGYFLEAVRTEVEGEGPGRGLFDEEQPRLLVHEPSDRLLEHSEAAERAERAVDPLLRSGLGLAGANARRSGEGEDGLLTALEATGLDLWGTRLVVLSACDTGVGEVKSGDGVYGLRRALVLAGAETTMVSLWPVSDRGTRDLMIEFYRKLMAGASRNDALRRTQLEMLRDPARRHPFFWASFIQSGAWDPIRPTVR